MWPPLFLPVFCFRRSVLLKPLRSAHISRNATHHKFIDIHATRPSLSCRKLFDGPSDPARPSLSFRGRLDPADPVGATDGRQIIPQCLRLVERGKSNPEIGGDGRFRLWLQDSEFHRVARVSTGALAHGLVHVKPMASGCVGFYCSSKRMTVYCAFDLRHVARGQFLTDRLRDVEQGRRIGLRHLRMPKQPCLEAKH